MIAFWPWILYDFGLCKFKINHNSADLVVKLNLYTSPKSPPLVWQGFTVLTWSWEAAIHQPAVGLQSCWPNWSVSVKAASVTERHHGQWEHSATSWRRHMWIINWTYATGHSNRTRMCPLPTICPIHINSRSIQDSVNNTQSHKDWSFLNFKRICFWQRYDDIKCHVMADI